MFSPKSFFDRTNGFMNNGRIIPTSTVYGRKKRDYVFEVYESCETKCKRLLDIIAQGGNNVDEMLVKAGYNSCIDECS